jgi:hypothetical protein
MEEVSGSGPVQVDLEGEDDDGPRSAGLEAA